MDRDESAQSLDSERNPWLTISIVGLDSERTPWLTILNTTITESLVLPPPKIGIQMSTLSNSQCKPTVQQNCI
jgi:hypothetical protein